MFYSIVVPRLSCISAWIDPVPGSVPGWQIDYIRATACKKRLSPKRLVVDPSFPMNQVKKNLLDFGCKDIAFSTVYKES